MTAQACVLSIDLGTSGPKCVLVSDAGEVLGVGRSLVQTHHGAGGSAEQDAREVWMASITAMRMALQQAGLPPGAVRAIICGSQYSSIVPVDAAGEPLARMMLWLDQRGKRARLKRLPGFPRFSDLPWQILNSVRLHGLAPVASGMSVNHMRYFRYACPEIYARTAYFLEPMDFLAMRLTGRAQATQVTSFMSLCTDNRSGNATRYHPALLRYALIDEDKLPPLLPSDASIGPLLPAIAAELGLDPATQVITGINDTQSGAMGSYAFGGSHAGLAIGTSSVLVAQSARKKTDIINSLFCLPSPRVGDYLAVAEVGISGAALESFLRNTVFAEDEFTPPGGEIADHYAALEAAVARVAPGAEGLLYLPWLTGSVAPKSDSHIRGGFLNLTPQTTRSHMARAVLEGIALNLRWAAGPLQDFLGRRFSHYLFYGGGARSAASGQILADVLGAPVHAMENPQYITAIGAALVAFQRLGLIDYADFAARLPTRAEFLPNPALRGLYDARFGHFTQAFGALKPLSRAMNGRGA